MKIAILSSALFVMIAVSAAAQVSKADFTTETANLSNCIKQGNAACQVTSVKTLNGMMDKQLGWLQTDINNKQAAYNTDKGQFDQLDMTLSNDQTNQQARTEEKKNLSGRMVHLQREIDNEKSKQRTELGLYKELQSLTNNSDRQPAATKNEPLGDLNQFAATLS